MSLLKPVTNRTYGSVNKALILLSSIYYCFFIDTIGVPLCVPKQSAILECEHCYLLST